MISVGQTLDKRGIEAGLARARCARTTKRPDGARAWRAACECTPRARRSAPSRAEGKLARPRPAPRLRGALLAVSSVPSSRGAPLFSPGPRPPGRPRGRPPHPPGLARSAARSALGLGPCRASPRGRAPAFAFRSAPPSAAPLRHCPVRRRVPSVAGRRVTRFARITARTARTSGSMHATPRRAERFLQATSSSRAALFFWSRPSRARLKVPCSKGLKTIFLRALRFSGRASSAVLATETRPEKRQVKTMHATADAPPRYAEIFLADIATKKISAPRGSKKAKRAARFSLTGSSRRPASADSRSAGKNALHSTQIIPTFEQAASPRSAALSRALSFPTCSLSCLSAALPTASIEIMAAVRASASRVKCTLERSAPLTPKPRPGKRFHLSRRSRVFAP